MLAISHVSPRVQATSPAHSLPTHSLPSTFFTTHPLPVIHHVFHRVFHSHRHPCWRRFIVQVVPSQRRDLPRSLNVYLGAARPTAPSLSPSYDADVDSDKMISPLTPLAHRGSVDRTPRSPVVTISQGHSSHPTQSQGRERVPPGTSTSSSTTVLRSGNSILCHQVATGRRVQRCSRFR